MKWEYLVVKRITFEKGVCWLVNDALDETLEKWALRENLNR